MDQTSEGTSSAPATSISPLATADTVFPGDGEMATLMRAMDWSQTALGPVETWSPSLRMMARFLLLNRFPLLLWWGPEFLQLYNDAYRPVLGAKHPQYVGRSVRECWSEIIDVIGPLIETPFNGGPSTWMEDIFLEVNRHGFVEETHFTIAYSPVPDDTAPNGIGGVLATVHEISEKVVGERRVEVLRDLSARSAEAKTAEEACQIVAESLAHHPKDLPFALLYLITPDGKQARLAAAAGTAMGASISPLAVELATCDTSDAEDSCEQTWPLAQVVRTETVQIVENLAARFDAVPPGPWSDPPDKAIVAPIRSNIAHRLAGVLVAGVSSRSQLDDTYRGFFELATSQIATAITNARAYEEERRRAEALAEIDRAKTAFFSNVSHEFRTPLTLLLGPLEDSLAEPQDAMPPRQRERLEVMRRNGIRLLKLVNTLLDFARIEAGRVQAVYELTDLPAYTAELASIFRSLIEKAGMTLIVDCPLLAGADGQPPAIYVDREMWEKIVLNLLSNAFKFTFEGTISVTLRLAGDGSAVELEVRDTGTGIPPDELPRLFERFHRVEGVRARTYEGSGIGLALVQELVHLHGGAIRAESAEGKGTTFVVRLPVGAAHLPPDRIYARFMPATTLVPTALGAAPFVEEARRWLPDAPPVDAEALTGWLQPEISPVPSPAMPSATPSGSLRPARVLLADDNADMREYLRRLLGERYEVEAVPNGLAALAAARERLPDLVLSDIMMPELDGFGLLAALRADPHTRAIPVILLSARAGDEATVEGLRAGADDYLIKPFSAREVLARVAAHLEMARLRTEAVARARQFEAIFESVADGVVIYDETGSLLQWNAALSALFELDQMPDYAGLPITTRPSRLHARDEHDQPIAAEHLPFMRALRGEILTGTRAVDLTVTVPSGTDKYVNVSAAPLYDDTGRAIGVVAVYRDVTERKRAERETQERGLALEEANRRMDEFLGIASHELRTPLTTVQANVQLIDHRLRRLTSPAVPATNQPLSETTLLERLAPLSILVERTERQMHRLNRLIGDLLDVTRIQSNKLEFMLERCDLIAIVREAVEAQRAAWPERSITLDAARRRILIHADADRIGQVVTNYLTNALKYSPPDQATTVRVRMLDGTDGSVRVEVRDHGIGLSPEQQAHLFERFYRVPGIEQQSGSGIGLGLGLYICRTIVERHGGAFGVESAPGDGSTFWFTLPLATHVDATSNGHAPSTS